MNHERFPYNAPFSIQQISPICLFQNRPAALSPDSRSVLITSCFSLFRQRNHQFRINLAQHLTCSRILNNCPRIFECRYQFPGNLKLEREHEILFRIGSCIQIQRLSKGAYRQCHRTVIIKRTGYLTISLLGHRYFTM